MSDHKAFAVAALADALFAHAAKTHMGSCETCALLVNQTASLSDRAPRAFGAYSASPAVPSAPKEGVDGPNLSKRTGHGA